MNIIYVENVFNQSAIIDGKVYNSLNNETLPNAIITLDDSIMTAISDIEGNYSFENLKSGTYTLTCKYLGFKTKVISEIIVTNAIPFIIDFALEEDINILSEVIIKAPIYTKTMESPVSLNTITVTEINRSPGSNRNISKVIQSLPGKGSTVSNRNDILIRGGAPNENRFYIDGIEISNINHFSTQGSTGGPVGILNPNLISEVSFYAGAFPANRGNTLSSVFDFKMKDARKDKIGGSVTLGASEAGITLEGPLTEKGN